MFGESSDPTHPVHEYFKERWRAGDERMVESIRRLQAAGVIDTAIEPDRASRWIHTAWEGLQLQWLAEQDFDIERLVDSSGVESSVSHTGYAFSAGAGASIRMFRSLWADMDAKYFRLSRDRNIMRLGGGVSLLF